MFNGSSLYGGAKKSTTNVYRCDCGQALQTQAGRPTTLMRGTCTMITSTQSNSVHLNFELNYSQPSDVIPGLPNHLTLDVLPAEDVGHNTGNAFPAVDGWVLFDFDPVPPVFPKPEDSDAGAWPTIIVPKMSQYMVSSQQNFVEGDYWIATFHPEKAVVLAHHSSPMWFESGETWKIKKTIRFPIPSV